MGNQSYSDGYAQDESDGDHGGGKHHDDRGLRWSGSMWGVPGAAESSLTDAWRLAAEPALARGRRRSMRAWALGVVAAGVVVAGCTGSSSQSPTPEPSPSASTRTIELLPGDSVHIPSAWYTAEPHFVGSSLYELLFVSSARFEESCPPLTPAGKTCVRGVYEPVSPPPDGVVMLWVETPVRFWPGRRPDARARGGRRPPPGQGAECGSVGTLFSLARRRSSPPQSRSTRKIPGSGMELSACFGPRASAQVHREVQIMIESLRVQSFKN